MIVVASYLNGIGEAYFFSRRFDEAAANLLASVERAPGFPITYRVLASCLAHMGRLDDARQIIARCRFPVVLEARCGIGPKFARLSVGSAGGG